MNSESESNAGYRAFVLALASGICFVFSFYPFGWGWMGWFAPIGVLLLVMGDRLPGRKPWLQIWLGCFLCWLALFQCVRLPHWAGYIGWPILSGFLGSYLFLFVVVARHLVHYWRLSILVVAPVVWAGLEYIQAHFCTGISLGMLSHTQAEYPLLIQVADLAGCYTVSFLMLAIVSGAVIIALFFWNGLATFCGTKSPGKSAVWWGGFQALTGIGILLGYGYWKLSDADGKQVEHPQRIALVQGSIDTRFPAEAELREYLDSFTRHYTDLSVQAAEQDVDLLIWPETTFPVTDVFAPPNGSLSEREREQVNYFAYSLSVTAHLVTGAGEIETTPNGQQFKRLKPATPILAGASSAPVGKEQLFYNSCIQIDERGQVVNRYGKMKLVLFGEFVPLGDVFPWLYQFFPIPPGLRAWEHPVAMEWENVRFSPSICFESTYPHLLRSHCLVLEEQGKKPDVLVNLTNDGWFYGSTALDLHFANNVFRAVENRTTVMIAANTGFSGQIDSAGRVLAKGPRHKAELILVNLVTSKQVSPYHWIGDWPVFICFIAVLVGFFSMFAARFSKRKLQLGSQSNLEQDPELVPER